MHGVYGSFLAFAQNCGLFCGCRYNKSTTTYLGSTLGPLNLRETATWDAKGLPRFVFHAYLRALRCRGYVFGCLLLRCLELSSAVIFPASASYCEL